MIHRRPTPEDIAHVFTNLREPNRRELFAQRFNDDVGELIQDVIALSANSHFRQVLCAPDGEPVTFLDIQLRSPFVGSATMVSTPLFEKHLVSLCRFIDRQVFPKVIEPGWARLQCIGLPESRRIMRFFGFRFETPLFNAGRNGEELSQYAWMNPDFNYHERT